MTLHEKIKNEIGGALREKNQLKLNTARGLLAAFTNELVAKRRKPDEILGDEEARAVIQHEAKKRKDSIEQFRAGGRDDLATAEEAELRVLETYLPAQASTEEIKNLAEAKKAALGITDKSKSGQLMAALMKELKGRADGAAVRAVVEKLFS